LAPANSINEYEFQAKHSEHDYFAKITIESDKINLHSCGYISFDRIRGIERDCCKVNVKTCMCGLDKYGKTTFNERWIVNHHIEFENCELADTFCNKLVYRQKETDKPIGW
jgi:hypothetical protein